MRFAIFSGSRRNRALLLPAEVRLQSLGDRLCNFRFGRKDISQLAIVSLGPEMRVGQCIDELHIYANLVRCLLNAPLENVRNTKLFRDLGEVARFALITLCRRARDYF